MPVAQTVSQTRALDPLLDSIPTAQTDVAEATVNSTEAAAHGD
jgi:hypothetical protein